MEVARPVEEEEWEEEGEEDEEGWRRRGRGINPLHHEPFEGGENRGYAYTAAELVGVGAPGRQLAPSPRDPLDRDLPASVDLLAAAGGAVGVENQGPWGSCTAQAMAYAWRLKRWRAAPGAPPPQPSRAYWYDRSRASLAILYDGGSTNTATAAVAAQEGVVPEAAFPYVTTNLLIGPSAALVAAAQAAPDRAAPTAMPWYADTATMAASIKAALAAGRCVVLGVQVYESFESKKALKSGDVPMPVPGKEKLLGGHAICLTGYRDDTQRFSFPNSWGTKYGARGLFTLPYAYAGSSSLAADAWEL